MKNDKIDELLNSSTKEELIFMFKDLINDYEGLEEKILFKYVKLEENEEINKNKKYLSDIIKRYGSGRRFLSWRECGKFAQDIFEVLYSAKTYYYDTSKPLVPIETSIAIIRKMISAIQYMDDSNGDIGDIINESIGLIDEVCSNYNEFSKKEKTKIFTKLLNEADKAIYDGWEEWRIGIITNCIYFCDDEKLRIKFQNKLDNMLDNYLDDWSGEYNKQSILQIKLRMISIYGTEEAEKEFIESNVHYSEFRELLINRCIKNKEYDRVINLTEEGELQDKQYMGLVQKWKRYRYIAYKNLNIVDKKKQLAKELFLSGDMNYYYELKDIYINDWSNYYLELKKEIKEKNLYIRDIYTQMLIEENDLEELLEFTKADVRRIEIYDELLIKDYRNDVNIMYQFLIEKMAEVASDRKQYKKVCKIIKRYKTLFGDIEAYKIVKALQKQYLKRPAFIDELGKV